MNSFDAFRYYLTFGDCQLSFTYLGHSQTCYLALSCYDYLVYIQIPEILNTPYV